MCSHVCVCRFLTKVVNGGRCAIPLGKSAMCRVRYWNHTCQLLIRCVCFFSAATTPSTTEMSPVLCSATWRNLLCLEVNQGHQTVAFHMLGIVFPFSALTLLVGRQEGHPACKRNWMLVCWWWWFDWSFVRLIAPVVQLSPPPPSFFASINTGKPRFTWIMAVKMEREFWYWYLWVSKVTTKKALHCIFFMV